MSEPVHISKPLDEIFERLKNPSSVCFCENCGTYLKPSEGKATYQNGNLVLLCNCCIGRAATSDAAEFERKNCMAGKNNICDPKS